MSFLLDSCVLSEFVRKQPDPTVLKWMAAQPEDHLYLSTITLGEISRGIAMMPESDRRKERLSAWLMADVRMRFGKRLLPVSETIALDWGRLSGTARRQGKQLSMANGLIAATALHHSLVIVTRNTKDMEIAGAAVLNPWG